MRLEILRGPAPWEPGRWLGAILCADMRGADGRPLVHKGHRLERADGLALEEAAPAELHLLWLEAGDVDEDSAAIALARLVAGAGVGVGRPVESQVRLRSSRRGLLRVDSGRLHALNAVEDCTVFTLPDGVPVDSDRSLAGVKVTPLAVSEATLRDAERAVGGAPLLEVRRFLPLRVAAVVRERLSEAERERFERSLRTKVAWFGGRVVAVRYVGAGNPAALRDALAESALEADVSLAAGVASTDPLDSTWRAVLDAGATVVRRGLPVHPGSSYWLVELEGRPVIGVASCGMFSRRTALDLLLTRCFAGDRLDPDLLAGLGHGGLLGSAMAWRFPAYPSERSED